MRKTFIFVLLLLIAPTWYAYQNGANFLEKVAENQLSALGISNAKLSISELNFKRISFSGVSLGDTLKVPALNASFEWTRLLSGTIETIEIEGLELHVVKQGDQFSFGELDALIFGSPSSTSGSSGTLDWPVKTLRVTNAAVYVDLGPDDLDLSLSGDIQKGRDGVLKILNGQVFVKHTLADLHADLEGSLTPEGDLSAALRLDRGDFQLPALRGSGARGEMHVQGNMFDFGSFQLTADADLASLNLLDVLSVPARLSAKVEGLTADMKFEVPDNASGLSGVISLLSFEKEGQPHIALRSELASSGLEKLPKALGLPTGLEGKGVFQVALEHPVQSLEVLLAKANVAEVTHNMPPFDLQVNLTGLGLSKEMPRADLKGRWRLFGDGQAVLLSQSAPMHLRFNERYGGHYQDLMPSIYNPAKKEDLAFVLETQAEQPLFRLKLGGERLKIEHQSSLSFGGGGLSSSKGRLTAQLQVDPDTYEVKYFDLSDFHIQSQDWVLDQQVFLSPEIQVKMRGQPDDYNGTLNFEGGVLGQVVPGIEISKSSVNLPLVLQGGTDQLRVSLPDCGRLDLGRLSLHSTDMQFNFPSLCLTSGQDALYKMEKEAGQDKVNQESMLKVGFPERPLRLTLDDGHRISMGGKGSVLTLRSQSTIDPNFDLVGQWQLSGQLRDLVSSDYKIRAHEVSFSSDADMQGREARADFKVGELSHVDRLPYFSDLGLSLDVTLSQDLAQFNGDLTFLNKAMGADLQGKYDLSSSTGRFLFRPDPVRFARDGLALSSLSPFGAQYVSSLEGGLLGVVTGQIGPDQTCVRSDLNFRRFKAKTRSTAAVAGQTVELSGGQIGAIANFCDTAQGLRSNGSLLIENANGQFGALEMRKVNTALKLEDLINLKTQGTQQVSIGVVNVGIPMDNGLIDFEIDGPEAISLKNLSFKIADGHVATKPFDISEGEVQSPVILEVEGVRLKTLLENINVSGISGSGVLDGRLPIFVEEGRPHVEKGLLEARGPGVLRYLRGGDEEESVTAMVYQALENFHYDILRLELNEEKRQELSVRLKARGGNPDFFDGFPVELDVGLHGSLESILKDSLTAYQVPDTIKNRMLKYGN